MIHCINYECKFRDTCMTAEKQDDNCEEVTLPTPKFSDACVHYFCIENEEVALLDREQAVLAAEKEL